MPISIHVLCFKHDRSLLLIHIKSKILVLIGGQFSSLPSGDSGNWPPSHSQHTLPMLQGSSTFGQEKVKEDEGGSGMFLKPRPT